MRQSEARYPDVVEWDEYGQGYNAKGECVVCICGRRGCTDPHVDPRDEPDSDGGMDGPDGY